jgi:hypothetical protein
LPQYLGCGRVITGRQPYVPQLAEGVGLAAPPQPGAPG